jgi:hypothetical protein
LSIKVTSPITHMFSSVRFFPSFLTTLHTSHLPPLNTHRPHAPYYKPF